MHRVSFWMEHEVFMEINSNENDFMEQRQVDFAAEVYCGAAEINFQAKRHLDICSIFATYI